MEPFIPMLARTVESLPTGEHLRYEPKWDGFRATAGTGPVEMYSRNGRRLHARFPEIAGALREQMPARPVLMLTMPKLNVPVHTGLAIDVTPPQPQCGQGRPIAR